ncbi:Lipoyltransferase and lipoate-protein ligase [Pterulicium gracile]|uniref:Putative lipoate-protein ligase A n=1 Tax=Pterulicium gracile TaxID=1884261 RepID=A0A5C3QUX3_9AGAR|nr:Lipoyltransferase and lipoate-protein ligase [Pterula gracilis]
MISTTRPHTARAGFRSVSALNIPQRRLSSSSTTISPQHTIYLSNSTDPYFNLTLEDWLFKHKDPQNPLLLIYRDKPCVVIGRNQNPWMEVNLASAANAGIPFIRRRSGGGTVYHDLGNTNYSMHLPRKTFDKSVTAQVVARALRALDIDADVNARNDICVGKNKISGSAYKIANNRAYHHGTMLITTQLDTLGDLLRVPKKDSMISKGVSSVRSPVCNLNQVKPGVTHDEFVQSVIKEFSAEFSTDNKVHEVDMTEELCSVDYIQRGMRELQSWDWQWGQTPEFTYGISTKFPWGDVDAKISSRHGRIQSCVLNAPSLPAEEREQLESFVASQRYGFSELGSTSGWDEKVVSVWNWIVAKTRV